MWNFAGRFGLAFVVAALCLGGGMARAQVAPVPYWIPSWPFAFGSNPTAGQSSNTYGNITGFEGSDFSVTRYNFSNGFFGVTESGSLGLTANGINQYAPFGNSLYYQGAQFGYNFQNSGGLPLKVYAGFAQSAELNIWVSDGSSPAITRNLTEGVHATTAGILAESALEHLRAVRKSIGQPAPPAQD